MPAAARAELRADAKRFGYTVAGLTAHLARAARWGYVLGAYRRHPRATGTNWVLALPDPDPPPGRVAMPLAQGPLFQAPFPGVGERYLAPNALASWLGIKGPTPRAARERAVRAARRIQPLGLALLMRPLASLPGRRGAPTSAPSHTRVIDAHRWIARAVVNAEATTSPALRRAAAWLRRQAEGVADAEPREREKLDRLRKLGVMTAANVDRASDSMTSVVESLEREAERLERMAEARGSRGRSASTRSTTPPRRRPRASRQGKQRGFGRRKN